MVDEVVFKFCAISEDRAVGALRADPLRRVLGPCHDGKTIGRIVILVGVWVHL